MTPKADLDAVGIFEVLNRHEVSFVVVGGYAVATHGVIRATDDLDLVVDRAWDNAGRLGAALSELAAFDATGADTPLTAEVLARREDWLFETSLGRIHLLNKVGTVPSYRELMPAETYDVEGERAGGDRREDPGDEDRHGPPQGRGRSSRAGRSGLTGGAVAGDCA